MRHRLCPRTNATSIRRRPAGGHRPVLFAIGLVVAAAAMASAAPFDSYATTAATVSDSSAGLSSVMVGEGVPHGPTEMEMAGEGWSVTDGGGEPELVSEGAAFCPNGSCPDAACPPWNGMPGLINRRLGDACPRLVWSVDALMLWQGNVESRPLFYDPATQLTALDVNQLNTPVSVGPRVGLILNLSACHGIEANWFDVQPFGASQVLGPGASQYAMDNIAGMTTGGVDSALVSQTAAFKSFELNWRRRTWSPVTWLAGFRWVEWDQKLNVLDTYGGGAGTDTTSVLTGSNLYGGQIGVDALLWNTGRWLTVNGIAKAGLFYNYQAFQRTDLLGDRTFGTFSATENGTAFLGEVGVNGTVQILEWLYWRAGYNFFWLSGVAMPASQLSSTNQPAPPTTTVNHSGRVFLQGVNTGLEIRW